VWLNIKMKFSNKIQTLVVGFSLVWFSVYPQSSASKISDFKVNEKQSLSPGEIIASCVVEEGGDIPYKRYALVYTDFEDNTIRMLLEKTVVQWGGWSWSEVTWFSPVTQKKSCRVSLENSECIVTLAPETELKLKLIDSLGDIRVEQLAKP